MAKHPCWSTGTSSSPPELLQCFHRPPWSATFPRGQGGECGQGAFDRTCLKAGIQQTQFVSCCVISSHTYTHTQREKGEEGKKPGRNVWQAGEGLALLSAEKETFLGREERGEQAGCHTRAWQGWAPAPTAGSTGTNWSHSGKNSSFFELRRV